VPHDVLVTYTRGPHPESEHHGAYCVVEKGKVVRSRGDVGIPVFLRSAAKPFQAVTVVCSGAPDRFGFTDEELAMVVGSHDGSPRHAATAASMLRKAGQDPSLLRCGGHISISRDVYEQYVREGFRWGRLEDNCSGKHSGMIAAAVAMAADPARYADRDHPVQRANLENVALFTGLHAEDVRIGTDGCAVPSFAVPVQAMARAAARFTHPDGLDDARAGACRRLLRVVAENPEMVAGPKRFDTRLIRLGRGKILAKEGAEAVQIVGVAGRDLGIAVKIADGGKRASQAVIAALLVEFGVVEEEAVADKFRAPILSREGDPVGEVRVSL